MASSSAFPVRGAVALVLTAAGSALVVGFQPPQAAVGSSANVGTAPTSPTSTQTATRPPAAGSGSNAGSGSTGSGGGSASGSTGSTGSNGSTGSTGGSGAYKNGSFTGGAAQDPFGVVQVVVTISSGKITDVQTVQQPGDRRSTRINSFALPVLHDQAISAQSAQIDGVSGATWTSQAYAESLQSALDSAKG